MPRFWIELRVDIPPSLAEGVSNFLIEQGSPGVIQEDSAGLSGRRRQSIVAYFPKNRSYTDKKKKIRKYLSSLAGVPGGVSLRQQVIPDENWAEAWKVNFRTFRATPHLVIKPPWEEYRGRKGDILIEIDPGMAFGTGHHPSTRMCLVALEELIPSFQQPPTVLDVGTGSGILAIAARKMGAGKTLAVDIDPVAVECARKNAAANRAKRIDFRAGSPGRLRRRFDIVVANLLPQELLPLAPFLAGRIHRGGILVVSGVLREQKEEIGAAFLREELVLRAFRELKGWVCLEFRTGKEGAKVKS